ncbi:MAG TPA: hypothetical protein VIL35_08615 [Vicinamibacterales bacterium]
MRVALVVMVMVLVGLCGTADAQSSRQGVSRCRPQSAADRASFSNHGFLLGNVDYTRAITVVCPSLDTSVHPNGQITEILVMVQDNSEVGSFSARACRTARQGTGHACTPWASSGDAFTGFMELSLSPGNVWSSNDFGYLEVRIPPIDGSHVSHWMGWIARR